MVSQSLLKPWKNRNTSSTNKWIIVRSSATDTPWRSPLLFTSFNYLLRPSLPVRKEEVIEGNLT